MASPIETWMPLYIGDALRETIGMTLEERGAYVWLNMSLWQSGGSLPMDPPRLARSIGCDVATFNRIWESIAPIYEVVDGCVRSRRLDEHMSRALKAHQSLAERGKAGAAKRWDGRAIAEPCDGDGRGMAGDAPSPSQSHTKTTTETTPRAKRSAPTLPEDALRRARAMREAVVRQDPDHTWGIEATWRKIEPQYADTLRLMKEQDGITDAVLDDITTRWGEIPHAARDWPERGPKWLRKNIEGLRKALKTGGTLGDVRRGVAYTGTDAEFEEMARKYGRADG